MSWSWLCLTFRWRGMSPCRFGRYAISTCGFYIDDIHMYVYSDVNMLSGLKLQTKHTLAQYLYVCWSWQSDNRHFIITRLLLPTSLNSFLTRMSSFSNMLAQNVLLTGRLYYCYWIIQSFNAPICKTTDPFILASVVYNYVLSG